MYPIFLCIRLYISHDIFAPKILWLLRRFIASRLGTPVVFNDNRLVAGTKTSKKPKNKSLKVQQ